MTDTKNNAIMYPDGTIKTFTCKDKQKKIGSGGYGTVIMCEDGTKVLKTSNLPMNREMSFMEKTKGKMATSWTQMYPVIVYPRVVTKKTTQIAMDFMQHTLSARVIAQKDLRVVAETLVRQLNDFHRQTECTHNDIKPENIGMNKKNETFEVKFIDLGSTIHKSEQMDSTIGTTLMYNSPLEDLNNHTSRIKADKWALGCTIFEIVCKAQFPKTSELDHKLFYGSHLKNPLVSIRLIINMTPCNLRYILGLSETYDDSKHDFEQYLQPKRTMFKYNDCGKLIFELMNPAFDEDAKKKVCTKSLSVRGGAKPKRNASKKKSVGKKTFESQKK